MANRFSIHPYTWHRLHRGALGPYLHVFAALLQERGYCRQYVSAHLRAVADLSRWLERQRLGAEALTADRSRGIPVPGSAVAHSGRANWWPCGSCLFVLSFFRLLLLAADIIHWFKRLSLPPAYLTTTLDTIRTDLLLLPARLVREHKQTIVKMPPDYHHREEFLAAMRAIRRLRPLKNSFPQVSRSLSPSRHV